MTVSKRKSMMPIYEGFSGAQRKTKKPFSEITNLTKNTLSDGCEGFTTWTSGAYNPYAPIGKKV